MNIYQQCPLCPAHFEHVSGAGAEPLYLRASQHMQDAHKEHLFTCGRRRMPAAPQDQGIDYHTADGGCSFCGSIKPEEFFERVALGDLLGPTDKPYKVYLSGREIGRRWAKFYFEHFSTAHRQRFIELLNAGHLKLEFPHNFYVRPYFVRQDAKGTFYGLD